MRKVLVWSVVMIPLLGLGQGQGKKSSATTSVSFEVVSVDRDFPGPWNPDVALELEDLEEQNLPFYFVIRDNAQLQYLTQGKSMFELPEEYDLLFFSVGQRPTGGYALTVDKIEIQDNLAKVYYYEGDGSTIAIQKLTYPGLWLLIPNQLPELQMYQVPYIIESDIETGLGVGMRLTYRRAQGIVYTEYLPITSDGADG